jgi:hypothetical protein
LPGDTFQSATRCNWSDTQWFDAHGPCRAFAEVVKCSDKNRVQSVWLADRLRRCLYTLYVAVCDMDIRRF